MHFKAFKILFSPSPLSLSGYVYILSFFLLSFEWTIGRQEVSVCVQPPSYLVICFTISVFQLWELHVKIHLLVCFDLSLLFYTLLKNTHYTNISGNRSKNLL